MEKWITRSVAALIACGALGLFWTFGLFVSVPAREGRLLSPAGVELQLIVVSLLAALVAAWGALHLFALADRDTMPKLHAATRVALLVAALAAAFAGADWSASHVAT